MQIRHPHSFDKIAANAPPPTALQVIRTELIGRHTCVAAGVTARSSAPVLALCRQLLAAGLNPDQPMEVFRTGTLALHIRSIGEAAGLEINSEGTGFRPARRPDAASPVRFGSENDTPPIPEAFPQMAAPELRELADDIKANGLAHAVVRDGAGTILDGRNRLAACEIAGIAPRFEEYKGDNPVGFIISANLRRRHLNESQRALVASKLATLSHGGDRRSDQAANLHLEIPKKSVAAAMLNVSERSLASAAVVRKHGTPELIRQVEDGKLSVSAAAKQAQPPKPKPKPKPPSPKPVIYIARIKSAFMRVEKAAAARDTKLFQKELRQLIEAAEEQIK